jgi:hypothetical protein
MLRWQDCTGCAARGRSGRLLGALALGAAFAFLPAGALSKQNAPAKEAPIELPQKFTREEADALLARLTDAQARQLLAQQLHREAEKQAPAEAGGDRSLAMLLVQLRQSLEGSDENGSRRRATLAEGWRSLPEALASDLNTISGGKGAGSLLLQLVVFAAIVAVGCWCATRCSERCSSLPCGRKWRRAADWARGWP